MAVVDDPSTLRPHAAVLRQDQPTSTSSSSCSDRFERGEITPEEWRQFRLLRGTYGQRQDADAQMLRVKIPQGILDAAHLEALAGRRRALLARLRPHLDAAEHPVPFRQAARRGAGDASPRGRGRDDARGVRQFGAQHHRAARTQVSRATKSFDVTPYAEAMTRYLLRHPLSSTLPRKFKIAFEGCAAEDHAATSINDLGWRAALDPDGSGRRGFRVNVAGGTAIMCRSGASLYEFLPASDILMVAEAVLRVFQRYGDYEHKQRNRLKFLVKSMGWDAWQAAFHEELDGCARRAARSCRSIRRTRRSSRRRSNGPRRRQSRKSLRS